MEKMTLEECMAFVAAVPRPAIAVVVRADGRPHATPVWVIVDRGDLLFTTWHESIKARVLRRDPRITLCIDDDRPPFNYATLEGTATLADDLADLRLWAGRIGGRYMGDDQADAYGARNGVPGELLVRVSVQRATGFRDVAL